MEIQSKAANHSLKLETCRSALRYRTDSWQFVSQPCLPLTAVDVSRLNSDTIGSLVVKISLCTSQIHTSCSRHALKPRPAA